MSFMLHEYLDGLQASSEKPIPDADIINAMNNMLSPLLNFDNAMQPYRGSPNYRYYPSTSNVRTVYSVSPSWANGLNHNDCVACSVQDRETISCKIGRCKAQISGDDGEGTCVVIDTPLPTMVLILLTLMHYLYIEESHSSGIYTATL